MVALQAQAGPEILVIDDSSTIRRSAEIFLSQSGYSVLLAEDGFEALSKIVERRPSLQAILRSVASSDSLSSGIRCLPVCLSFRMPVP